MPLKRQGAGMGGEKHPGTADRTAEVGIASFCPYNIGPGKCFPSRFINELMQVIEKVPAKRFAGDKGRWQRLPYPLK